MRKLILQEFVSLDGFCADREKTTGFFDGTYYNLESDVDENQAPLMDSLDLILSVPTRIRCLARSGRTPQGKTLN